MKVFLRTAMLVAGILIAPAAASACEGGKVLMEDSFNKLNRAWGVAIDPKLERIDGDGLSTDYPPGTVKRAISQWGFFDNAVACATFSVAYSCTDADRCETQPYVGLIVWGVDLENYYAFEVAPLVGIYSVQRLQNNKWLTPVNWTALPGRTKFNAGDKFEISAVMKGGLITFKVNDRPVIEFEAMAPDGGSLVGFELAAAQTGRSKTQLNLSRFEVRELTAESQ
ncbi:hypothetical protein [Mesorhizobium marinum]|uniref:3-keto-disaccharide hydrolase domain-containing protein n=1 Tax=Mesorhizobium marinum TaxID=3228790 RepID=A0ABV3R552_9HYPH